VQESLGRRQCFLYRLVGVVVLLLGGAVILASAIPTPPLTGLPNPAPTRTVAGASSPEWRRLPTGWWFVNLGVITAGFVYYWRSWRLDDRFGGRAWGVAAVLAVLHVFNSPWLSML
jgi:hypothetical protein